MPRLDLLKQLRHLYFPPADRVVQVDVPPMSYLMADGHGDPNSAPAYAAAVEALFSLAYALKFEIKRGPLGVDYGVRKDRRSSACTATSRRTAS